MIGPLRFLRERRELRGIRRVTQSWINAQTRAGAFRLRQEAIEKRVDEMRKKSERERHEG